MIGPNDAVGVSNPATQPHPMGDQTNPLLETKHVLPSGKKEDKTIAQQVALPVAMMASGNVTTHSEVETRNAAAAQLEADATRAANTIEATTQAELHAAEQHLAKEVTEREAAKGKVVKSGHQYSEEAKNYDFAKDNYGKLIAEREFLDKSTSQYRREIWDLNKQAGGEPVGSESKLRALEAKYNDPDQEKSLTSIERDLVRKYIGKKNLIDGNNARLRAVGEFSDRGGTGELAKAQQATTEARQKMESAQDTANADKRALDNAKQRVERAETAVNKARQGRQQSTEVATRIKDYAHTGANEIRDGSLSSGRDNWRNRIDSAQRHWQEQLPRGTNITGTAPQIENPHYVDKLAAANGARRLFNLPLSADLLNEAELALINQRNRGYAEIIHPYAKASAQSTNMAIAAPPAPPTQPVPHLTQDPVMALRQEHGLRGSGDLVSDELKLINERRATQGLPPVNYKGYAISSQTYVALLREEHGLRGAGNLTTDELRHVNQARARAGQPLVDYQGNVLPSSSVVAQAPPSTNPGSATPFYVNADPVARANDLRQTAGLPLTRGLLTAEEIATIQQRNPRVVIPPQTMVPEIRPTVIIPAPPVLVTNGTPGDPTQPGQPTDPNATLPLGTQAPGQQPPQVGQGGGIKVILPGEEADGFRDQAHLPRTGKLLNEAEVRVINKTLPKGALLPDQLIDPQALIALKMNPVRKFAKGNGPILVTAATTAVVTGTAAGVRKGRQAYNAARKQGAGVPAAIGQAVVAGGAEGLEEGVKTGGTAVVLGLATDKGAKKVGEVVVDQLVKKGKILEGGKAASGIKGVAGKAAPIVAAALATKQIYDISKDSTLTRDQKDVKELRTASTIIGATGGTGLAGLGVGILVGAGIISNPVGWVIGGIGAVGLGTAGAYGGDSLGARIFGEVPQRLETNDDEFIKNSVQPWIPKNLRH